VLRRGGGGGGRNLPMRPAPRRPFQNRGVATHRLCDGWAAAGRRGRLRAGVVENIRSDWTATQRLGFPTRRVGASASSDRRTSGRSGMESQQDLAPPPVYFGRGDQLYQPPGDLMIAVFTGNR